MKKRFLLNASTSLIVLFAMLRLTSGYAQVSNQVKDHLGFSVSFGTKSSKITSDHAAINNMKLMEEGGSAGVLWGNDLFETKLTVGYYYSSSNVAHTVDLINAESAIQFYPLSVISGRAHKVAPYISTGLSANNYKLYGYYTSNNESVTPNYSLSLAPYLGNVTNYYGSVGAGLEVNLLNQNDFVKLFTEVNYQGKLFQKSSESFKNTNISNQLSVNVGVSFGMNRFYSK